MKSKKTELIYPDLSYNVVGALFEVYNELGESLQEKHYQKGLALALKDRNIKFREKVEVPIKFKDKKISNYFLDFLVDDKIIIELKTKSLTKSYYDQLLSYLKTTDKRLGIVAVFGKDELRFRRVANLY